MKRKLDFRILMLILVLGTFVINAQEAIAQKDLVYSKEQKKERIHKSSKPSFVMNVSIKKGKLGKKHVSAKIEKIYNKKNQENILRFRKKRKK